MQVLFDTNIILDIALQRTPHFNDSVKLFSLIDENKISAYITASTVTDIYYISNKKHGHQKTISFIIALIEVVEVLGVEKENIISALNNNTIKDFEDAVQVAVATSNSIETIITRNKKDFKTTHLKVLTPKEFLNNN